MSLILSGSDGLSDVDGTAATPAIRGTDTNTGIFFPAADTIAFTEGGVESMRIDSAGNVGIGTSSNESGFRLHVTGNGFFSPSSGTVGKVVVDNVDQRLVLGSYFEAGVGQYSFISSTNNAETGNLPLLFNTGTTERMRIDSGGRLLIARTTAYGDGTIGTPILQLSAVTAARAGVAITSDSTSSTGMIGFVNPNGTVGTITISGSTTTYNTSSDYRLKENIAPMTGSLAKVAALKPCTYTWKSDGSASQGFIAHELQAVVPDAVTGEKDAVDEKGNPKYQGVDTSFLVATLTAAIQELKAELDSVKAELATLKA